MGTATTCHSFTRRKRARTDGTPRKDNISFPVLDEEAKQNFGIKSQLQIHESSFVHWDVSEVIALAASTDTRRIVVARANGSVELRSKDVGWAVASVVHPEEADSESSISSICFSECSRYVFVGRLDGILLVLYVTEEGIFPHTRLDPGGGAIWDVAVSKYDAPRLLKLAIASDDGCVRFVEPDNSFTETVIVNGNAVPVLPEDSINYIVRSSETTSSRALSVAWAPPSGDVGVQCVVCGDSGGGIRWINPENGQAYGNGKLSSLRGESVKIWTVIFVQQGNLVVCGDSRGMATIWSSSTNTLHQEVHVEGIHGSIWSSTLVGDGESETVFFGCAGGGVGGVQSLKSVGDPDRWLPLRGCRFHSHDVRALASFTDGTVFSGSMDARVCIFDIQKFVERLKVGWILPYHGCAGQPPVLFNEEERLILSRRNKGVDIWHVSDSTSQSPSLRLRMNLKSLTSGLISFALSPDCQRIAMSSPDSFRLYKIWDGNGIISETLSFGKVHLIPVAQGVESELHGAVDMTFFRKALFGVTRCKKMLFLLQSDRCTMVQKEEMGVRGTSLERVVCNGHFIAVSDSRGDVAYASLPKSRLQSGITPEMLDWKLLHCAKEGHPVCISAMSLSRNDSRLAVALSDFRVLAIALGETEKKKKKNIFVGQFLGIASCLSFASSESALLVSGESFCAVASVLPPKKDQSGNNHMVKRAPYMLPYRDSILGAAVVGPSKVVVVRRRWDLVQTSLPDAIPRDVFGT